MYSIFIILDAAKVEDDLHIAKEMCSQHSCLYKGESKENLGDVAPWLFELQKDEEFMNWLIEKASNNKWGIILRTECDFASINSHLRKFLIVHTEEGNEMYFRFYDPRVLGLFLKTSTFSQLKEFFGPINEFILEDEDGLMNSYSLMGKNLIIRTIAQDMEQYFKEKHAKLKRV